MKPVATKAFRIFQLLKMETLDGLVSLRLCFQQLLKADKPDESTASQVH
jgi:hypothetical protein